MLNALDIETSKLSGNALQKIPTNLKKTKTKFLQKKEQNRTTIKAVNNHNPWIDYPCDLQIK
jgi:hypothetical protein